MLARWGCATGNGNASSQTGRTTGSLRRGPFASFCLVLPVATGLLLAATTAQAADEERVLRARAAELANRGDCAAALPLLDQARERDPAGESQVELLRGRCLVQQERFEEARPLLERAVESQPENGEAALALGIARYEVGDVDGALVALERAETLLPDRPEPPLYAGLALLDRDRSQEAAERFERSNRLNTDGFDPISGYYAAIAHSGAGDAERAEESLREVERRGAGTVWGDRASEILTARRSGTGALPLRKWLRLQAGLDYDTNVSLRGDRVPDPANITSDNDGRGWWSLDGGADLWQKNGWRVGVGGRYTGFEYFRNPSFGQHFLTGRTWLDKTLGPRTLLRIAPEAGIGFFDGDDYLRFYGVRPEIRQDWGRAGQGTFYARYAYNDFTEILAPVATDQNFVDRDGHDLRAGYDHFVDVSETTTLRGGVFIREYWAEGGEFDHSGVGGWLGFGQALPWKLHLDASASFAYDDYDSVSRFEERRLAPGGPPFPALPERRDYIVTANADLSRPINEWLTVAARYQYLNNESNMAVFDYDRHIVGAYFTLDLLGLFGLDS